MPIESGKAKLVDLEWIGEGEPHLSGEFRPMLQDVAALKIYLPFSEEKKVREILLEQGWVPCFTDVDKKHISRDMMGDSHFDWVGKGDPKWPTLPEGLESNIMHLQNRDGGGGEKWLRRPQPEEKK